MSITHVQSCENYTIITSNITDHRIFIVCLILTIEAAFLLLESDKIVIFFLQFTK